MTRDLSETTDSRTSPTLSVQDFNGLNAWGPVPKDTILPRAAAATPDSFEARIKQMFSFGSKPGTAFITDTSLDDQWRDVQTAINTQNFGPHSSTSEAAVDAQRRAIWKQVRPLINAQGTSPSDAISDAFKTSTIVGIGEQHTKDKSLDALANLQYGIDHMKEYAAAGATDMFVELPKAAQPIFDAFNRDITKGDLRIPNTPEEMPGVDTNLALGSIQLLNAIKANQPKYLELWKAARDNNIALHAVDNDSAALVFSNPRDPRMPKLISQRDQDMATSMESVINSPTVNGKWSAQRKGLAWLGAAHLPDTHGKSGEPSAFEIMRKDLGGQKVTSFLTQIGANDQSMTETMFTVSRYVDRPVAVLTHDQTGAANVFGQINAFVVPNKSYNYTVADWTGVMIFRTTIGRSEVAGDNRALIVGKIVTR